MWDCKQTWDADVPEGEAESPWQSLSSACGGVKLTRVTQDDAPDMTIPPHQTMSPSSQGANAFDPYYNPVSYARQRVLLALAQRSRH